MGVTPIQDKTPSKQKRMGITPLQDNLYWNSPKFSTEKITLAVPNLQRPAALMPRTVPQDHTR